LQKISLILFRVKGIFFIKDTVLSFILRKYVALKQYDVSLFKWKYFTWVKNRFNIILCCLLLLLLWLQTGGFLAVCTLQLGFVHYEMREKVKHFDINSEAAECITMSLAQLEKHKINDYEIRWHHQMYDFKIINIHEGQVEIQAIRDHYEESLLKRIKHFFEKTENHAQKTSAKIVQQLLSLLYTDIFSTPFSFYSSLSHTLRHIALPAQTLYLQCYLHIHAPPPNLPFSI